MADQEPTFLFRTARILANLPSRAVDLCYPRDCVACGEPAGENYRWFCDKCAAKLPLTVATNCCVSCGVPFEGVVGTLRMCAECSVLKPHWTLGKTLLTYDGPATELVRRIKYNGERCLLSDVRTMLLKRDDILDMLRGATLVPVPLHSSRQRERGFNQSEWLAETFAREAGADVRDVLCRTRDTGTQTLLTLEERRKNVRGAFDIRRGTKVYEEAKYVLVDDVITTGSTLNACAEALSKAGAKDLTVLTLAHA
jgi:ComF family protein